MNERNSDILDAMNQLTTELEQESVASVSRLRIAQTLAFILSLLNFLFILHGMHRARFAAETASITDTLTGLLNRGGVYRELNSAIEICREDNIPLGVLMLDLDGFKAVNDNFGHAAGDASLREVARRLQGFCHLDWVCGRLGGDEFAVICPGVTEEFIADAAQQLTSILGGIPGGGLTISASVGWTSVKPGQTADAVIAMADAKMYSVKSDGRTAKNHRNNAR
jgi:diguanylate cyclase (GGDEF)-like protein